MSSPSYPPSYREYIGIVRREGQTLAGVGGLGLDEPVPTCPGWSVGRLLLHVGRVYRFAAEVLETRAETAPPRPEPPAPDADPVEYLQDGLEEVVAALGELDPGTPVWNWSVQPDTAAFWARRMAHESLMHRIDAKLAHDVSQVIPADLAVDGIDEALQVMAPRAFGRGVPGLEGTIHLAATDANEQWTAKVTPESISTTSGPGGARNADVVLAGKAADLLLLLYNRTDADSVQVRGDGGLLAAWQDRVKFSSS